MASIIEIKSLDNETLKTIFDFIAKRSIREKGSEEKQLNSKINREQLKELFVLIDFKTSPSHFE